MRKSRASTENSSSPDAELELNTILPLSSFAFLCWRGVRQRGPQAGATNLRRRGIRVATACSRR
jgi:hypothetical protein